MGLRINRSGFSLNSIRDAQSRLNDNLARIGSGKQILRASDNPAGLVISEQLGAQLASLNQAFDNTTFASNLFGTADAALDEVSGRLRDLRGLITQAQGTGDPQQQQAVQRAIDANLNAIDRIGSTTRFADNNLLDGSRSIQTNSNAPEILEANVFQANFAGNSQQTFNVDVTAAATQGTVTAANDVSDVLVTGAEANIQIRGELGTATITLGAGATGQNVLDAVNSVSAQTGVNAVNNGGAVDLVSANFGSNAEINVSQVSGGGNFTPANPLNTAGTDVQGTIDGQNVQADGNTINVSNAALDAEIILQDGAGPGQFSFTANNTGVTVQLGTQATPADQVSAGFRSISTATLGDPGARLSSLRAGGANDAFSNPNAALEVVDRAISQVSAQRARLGSVQSNVFDSNVNTLGSAIENITNSRSSILDADFAKEIVNKTRNELLLQAAIATQRQSQNILSSNVLSLLQSI